MTGSPRFTGSPYIRQLAERQQDSYRSQPADLIGHYHHERSITQAYLGRQILELLQNADDAGRRFHGERHVLFQLTSSHLVVANTGEPFSREGIRSLVVSDVSPKFLERTHYIGNKGLGFRAVLTWTQTPLVMSGDFMIAFSPEYAREKVIALARENPELAQAIREYERVYHQVPAALMRFPYVPKADDPRAGIARTLREAGYDTVIVLPLLEGRRKNDIWEDIRSQLEEVAGETLLFCRNLERITIEGDLAREWAVAREGSESDQTVRIEENGTARTWRVRREGGILPAELVEDGLQETLRYEIAVAVPEEATEREHHRLCVFFPTDDRLPTAMLAHATLETDDSRKRIIQHDANRFVLAELAQLMARVAATESDSARPHRGVHLLAGCERSDPELEALGFVDVLVSACRTVRLLPRLDGTMGRPDEIRLPPDPVWYEVASPTVFPEMLASGAGGEVKGFLAQLGLKWYDDSELAERLERRVAALGPAEAGALVGRLIGKGAVPKDPLPALLLAAGPDPHPLPADHTAFLPTERGSVDLPPWVKRFGFLDSEFHDELKMALGVKAERDVRARLVAAGYRVEEYQLEGILRHLAQEAEVAAGDLDDEDQRERTRQILRVAFQLFDPRQVTTSLNLRLNVLTMSGAIRPASECYLGPEYPGGHLVHALYAPLGEDEFVAGPAELGLPEDSDAVQRFLIWLGVADRPREMAVKSRWDVPGLFEHILSLLEYPNRIFKTEFHSVAEAQQGLGFVEFDGLTMPDRFPEVLDRAPAEVVLAYILRDGRRRVTEGERTGATFMATIGSERKTRPYPSIRVPDPVYYLLRTRAWVPADDGPRQPPSRLILSSTGRRALGRTFSAPAINTEHPLLRSAGGSRAIAAVLHELGAVHSLDALDADDLYRMLLELPSRDPSGDDARKIYSALLDGAGVDTSSPLRKRFSNEGRMWGEHRGKSAYYPVSRLRYAGRFSLPAQMRDRVPLVAIPSGRSAEAVKRIFDVQPLTSGDVTVLLNPAATEERPWWSDAHERMRSAVPFLYAYRLSRRQDGPAREREILRSVELRACTRIGVQVSVFGAEPELVMIDREHDGIVLHTVGRLLVVSGAVEVPEDPVFWRVVGDLLADAIDVASAGPDFAQLLGCTGSYQRRRLLDLMTGGRADEFLARAQEELDADDDIDIEGLSLPPEVTPADKVEDAETESAETSTDESEDTPRADSPAAEIPKEPAFEPVRPPDRRRMPRRRLVITSRGQAKDPPAPGNRVAEQSSLDIAIAYEYADGRYPLQVDHLRGTESPRCDIISFASLEARRRAEEEGRLHLDDVERFIEVKGRSDRGSMVELEPNQREAAEMYRERFFLYRVYRDPGRPRQVQLAILCDPVGSGAEIQRSRFLYDLRAGSGAIWLEVELQSDTLQPA